MRHLVTEKLISWLKENHPELNRIAVVGGSPTEPELFELMKIYPYLSVKYFGVDATNIPDNFIKYDLNLEQSPTEAFDLVICAQVLEHVWNFDIAMKNLIKLTKEPTGLLWINCPASNMAHGSPHYYSAGYSPEMLGNQTESLGMEAILLGQLGSQRAYFFTHALQYWASPFELRHPLLTYRPLRSYGKRMVSETMKASLGRLYSTLLSNRVTNNSNYATETYGLFKIKESLRP